MSDGLDPALARQVEQPVESGARRHAQTPFIGGLISAQRVRHEGNRIRAHRDLCHVQPLERIVLIVGK